MEPVTLTAGAIATLVLIKATETATEKATEKLGKLVVEKGGKLLSLLKIKSPSTATAIELSQQKPLDYNKAVGELEEVMEDPAVAEAIKEVNTAVNTNATLASAVKALANNLESQQPTVQNFGKIAEEIKEIKALIQGNVYGGITFNRLPSPNGEKKINKPGTGAMKVVALFGLLSFLGVITVAILIVGLQNRYSPPTETPRLPPPTRNEGNTSEVVPPTPAANLLPLPVSPSPTLVQPSTDQNPCTREHNGSTVNLDYLERSCSFIGNVTSNNLENRYRFKIDNPSNISLFLDDVNSEVQMSLFSDKDGTGVIGDNYGYTSAYKSKSGVIKKELGVGSYILVVRFKARNTNYSLQIVNDTSQVENVGLLEQKTIPKNGSVSLKKLEQFYGFQLGNPSNISLSLDGVNSEVQMSLFSNKDGTGVIGANYGYTSAFNSKPGIIKKELGRGNYIVVVRLKARETDYNLTISAP